MDYQLTRSEQNLILLQDLIPENERFYLWCYGSGGRLLSTTCPEEDRETLDRAFRLFGGEEKLLQYAADVQNSRPLSIGSPIGMQWALTYESERNRGLLFLIGPVFYDTPSTEHLREALRPFIRSGSDIARAQDLLKLVPGLPVLSYAIFSRYATMVHNSLTGQRLGLDSLRVVSPQEGSQDTAPVTARDRIQIYRAEQALLRMVRDGDINYQQVLLRSSLLSPGVPIQGRDPLRQMKTSVIVFTSLVSRAAMEGGLSPEIAYPVGDAYIQAAEDCRDSGELSVLANAMYHDFIYRVHQLHTDPGYSHAIRKCCDYIELSLDRRIRAEDLASLVGYSEYYLTEKFRNETGLSVSSYIKQAKIRRAFILLETTDLSVHEIAERLAFNTPNYFIQCFRDLEGTSPAQYRKKLSEKAGG
ncbi:MAG: helix-turn-helix transcriptional regulator [Lachnospiraceae bacterium]|nr:helix-turn-helix transcriptional regulator [Lachnospiraceae bacterium]